MIHIGEALVIQFSICILTDELHSGWIIFPLLHYMVVDYFYHWSRIPPIQDIRRCFLVSSIRPICWILEVWCMIVNVIYNITFGCFAFKVWMIYSFSQQKICFFAFLPPCFFHLLKMMFIGIFIMYRNFSAIWIFLLSNLAFTEVRLYCYLKRLQSFNHINQFQSQMTNPFFLGGWGGGGTVVQSFSIFKGAVLSLYVFNDMEMISHCNV